MKIDIVNSALDGVPEITLRGMIDRYEDGSISGAIDSCGASKLRMNINSMGGSVMLGQEVIAAMQAYKDNGGIIETVNRGMAYSTAGWIFAAGSKGFRKMMPFATILTHPPMYADGSTLADYQQGSEKHSALMDALNSLVDIFTPITNRTKAFIKKIMLNTTKFNAKQAVKEGFADEILNISNAVVLKEDLQPEEIINATESINYEIINKHDSNKNEKLLQMKEIAILLNLNPEASKEAIKGAVVDIINRAETAEAGEKAKGVSLEQKEAELSSVRNELNEIKDAEIINYVVALVAKDATKKEHETAILNMAKADFETFKALNPIDAVVNAGEKIDKGIKEEKGDEEDKSLALAKEFFNMSQPEKEKLKKEDLSRYNELVNAYDINANKIV